MTSEPTEGDRGRACAHILAWACFFSLSGCVVEKIDAIIAEHGVTYWPSSTGEDSGALDTSTSTGTSTSTSTHSSDTDGDASTTGSASGGGETIASSGPDSSSTSTGPAVPVCGDGVVDGDEDCDDGNANPNDGCHNCAKDLVVFVSSEVYQGFALEGIEGADQRCRTLAAKAGLMHPEKFAAWLSTSKSPAADRLNHSRGRYVLANGLVIAQDWDALTSGALENPIVVDEYSQTRDTPVWTGTLANGQPAIGSEFCGDWNSAPGPVIFGGSGLSSSTDSTWSFVMQASCDDENRLYCFEQ